MSCLNLAADGSRQRVVRRGLLSVTRRVFGYRLAGIARGLLTARSSACSTNDAKRLTTGSSLLCISRPAGSFILNSGGTTFGGLSVAVQRADLWADIASWLTVWHGRRQEGLAASIVSRVRSVWPILDFGDLSGTELEWALATLPHVEDLYRDSAGVSAEFIELFGAAKSLQDGLDYNSGVTTLWDGFDSSAFDSGGRNDGPILVPPTLDERLTIARLLAAGPGSVRHRMPAPETETMQTALSNVVGAVVETGMDGGRDFVRAYSEADHTILGWQRITDTDPCAFCALLASRGPKYFNLSRIARTDFKYTTPDVGESSDEAAKVHYHCRCTLIPVFRGSSEPLSGWARVAKELWELPFTHNEPKDWVLRRREFRRRYDRFKAKHPNEGFEVDERALRREVNSALRDVSDYREERLLLNVAALLKTSN